jgi:general stress protein 26
MDVAISQLSGVKLPVLTTVQINALTPVRGMLVYDSDLNVLKIYTGTWKVLITAN